MTTPEPGVFGGFCGVWAVVIERQISAVRDAATNLSPLVEIVDRLRLKTVTKDLAFEELRARRKAAKFL